MTAPVLKKLLGEAGAGVDDSHGVPSVLREILVALVKAAGLDARQVGAITATIKAARLVTADSVLGILSVKVGTTGTAGDTVVTVNIDGVAQVPTATVNFAEADGFLRTVDMGSLAVPAGSVVDIEVTTAPTAGADLDVALAIQSALVEA